MADIFISYASARRPDTIKLADRLEADGYVVWWDKELYLGNEIHSVVGNELAGARAVVVIWTPEAARSKWVIAEATRAQHENKLIAVRTPDLHPGDIPPPFNILSTGLVTDHEAILRALTSKGLGRRSAAGQPASDVAPTSVVDAPSKPAISRRLLAGMAVASAVAAAGAAGTYLAMPSRRPDRTGPLREWSGGGDYVASVAFGPDGASLLAGSWDRRLRLWDPAPSPPAMQADWEAHDGVVWWMAWLPGGRAILSAGEDGKLRLWDAANHKLLREYAEHRRPIWSAALLGGGQRFVSASLDGTLKTWNADDATSTRTIDIGSELHTVAASSQGDLVVVGGKGGLWTWRPNEDAEARPVPKHQGDVLALAMLSDGLRVLSGGDDGRVRAWNAASREDLPVAAEFGRHDGKVTAIAVSRNDLIAVSASIDRKAKVWNLRSGALIASLDHPEAVEAVAVAPDGATVVTACRDKRLRFWALPSVASG